LTFFKILTGEHPQSGWKKKSPALTVSQVRSLLEVVLPLRRWTSELKVALLAWVQQRNYQAYCSHRKRRRGLLDIDGA
jgi:hypothetical protein